jgi:hypothetical protein
MGLTQEGPLQKSMITLGGTFKACESCDQVRVRA